MTPKSSMLLLVQNVYKRFMLPGNRILRAVNGVSLEMRDGDCLAIVGESGSGKSTLARMVARIEPVTEGNIIFAGELIEVLRGEQLRQLRRKIQVVFQDPITSFSPRMRIGEFLSEPFINFDRLSKKKARERVSLLLASVGLPNDYIKKYPHQLSGGEQQRVVIARAVALNPLLLICDEPTSALDVSIQKQIIALLESIRREYGISILFISHDLALVQNLSDRVAVMYLGYIMENLPSEHLSREAKHPYTRALLQSVFCIDKSREEEIADLQGEPPNPIDLPPGCPFNRRCTIAEDRCFKERPLLREIAPEHTVACHIICV